MDIGKALIKSKAFLGGVLAMVPALAEAANYLAGTPGLPASWAVGIAAAGGAIAIVGRWVAKQKITSLL